VCGTFKGTDLCLPCYVDVIEVRQARGVMGDAGGPVRPESMSPAPEKPGNSPSLPFKQLDLFD